MRSAQSRGARHRYRQQAVDAVRSRAGVGDQSGPCPHDTPGCPGPDPQRGLPCAKCFLAGDSEAGDGGGETRA